MCGLCLPHCPTYKLTLDENESPRGRISLARALLLDQLESSEKTSEHIAHCLVCRACEKMCPSGVRYGKIINGLRAYDCDNVKSQPSPLTKKQYTQKLNHKIWWYQQSGVQKLVRSLGLLGRGQLARKESLLPKIAREQAWAEHYPATTSKKGQLQLFTGCISNSLDHKTLRDAVRVLNHLGYDVNVPLAQECCGAIDLHRGNKDAAEKFSEENRNAFEKSNDSVISMHSGCSASLVDYLQNNILDVCDFLIQENITPTFKPLQKRIVVHTPCSKKNVMRNGENVMRVLSTIPGATVVELPATLTCCGAAGQHMLDFPAQADAIREPSIEAIMSAEADILVTSNIGCSMHLQAGLRKTGMKIEVLHPINLIAGLLTD